MHDNPVARAVLTYENVDRVNMQSDYFTHVAPFYTATTVPNEPGYHLLPYCNNLGVLQPDGSTNFARLASVNLNLEVTSAAQIQAKGMANMSVEHWDDNHVYEQTDPGVLAGNPREYEEYVSGLKYEVIITASSLSILRMASGSAGFPVL